MALPDAQAQPTAALNDTRQGMAAAQEETRNYSFDDAERKALKKARGKFKGMRKTISSQRDTEAGSAVDEVCVTGIEAADKWELAGCALNMVTRENQRLRAEIARLEEEARIGAQEMNSLLKGDVRRIRREVKEEVRKEYAARFDSMGSRLAIAARDGDAALADAASARARVHELETLASAREDVQAREETTMTFYFEACRRLSETRDDRALSVARAARLGATVCPKIAQDKLERARADLCDGDAAAGAVPSTTPPPARARRQSLLKKALAAAKELAKARFHSSWKHLKKKEKNKSKTRDEDNVGEKKKSSSKKTK